jgi:hypothetical protein
MHVVTRLPQLLAVFQPRRPLKGVPAPLHRDRFDRGGLFGNISIAVAVELEEERRRGGIRRLRVLVDRVHQDVVEQLDARHRDAELDRGDHGIDRPSDRLEGADRGRDRFRHRMKPQRDLGDEAERAFGSDEQPRQIVPGGGLARPGARPENTAVREHDRQRQNVLAHGAVSHRGRAGGSRRGHAPDGGVGARIDREHEAGVPQRLRELQARHAGLYRDVEILHADTQDPIHLAQIDRDPAA